MMSKTKNAPARSVAPTRTPGTRHRSPTPSAAARRRRRTASRGNPGVARLRRKCAAVFLADGLTCQVLIQPPQDLLPVLRIATSRFRAPYESLFPQSHPGSMGARLEPIGQGGLTLSQKRVRAESSRHDDLIGRAHLTDLPPFIDLPAIMYFNGNAPASLRTQLRLPILEMINTGNLPPPFDILGHERVKSVLGSSRHFCASEKHAGCAVGDGLGSLFRFSRYSEIRLSLR